MGLITVGYDVSREDLDRLEALAPLFGAAVFVDNGPARHRLDRAAWQHLVPARNEGFGRAANLGAHAVRTPYLLFLNPDVVVEPSTVVELLAIVRGDPRIAGAGPRLGVRNTVHEANAGGAAKTLVNALVFAFAPARRFQRRQIWRATYPLEQRAVDVDWVSGACLLFRRSAFERIGGFPAGHFLYDEDVELGHLAQLGGHRTVVACRVAVTHRVGGSQHGDEHFRRWALGNPRVLRKLGASRRRAACIMAALCIGLARRALWREFLGRRQPWRYLKWTVRYLVRYGLDPPRDGPEPPP